MKLSANYRIPKLGERQSVQIQVCFNRKCQYLKKNEFFEITVNIDILYDNFFENLFSYFQTIEEQFDRLNEI